jgi:hypothetical protein
VNVSRVFSATNLFVGAVTTGTRSQSQATTVVDAVPVNAFVAVNVTT